MAVLLQIPLVIYSISEENLWNAWRWHFYLFVNILSNPIWSLSTNLSDRAHTASKFRKTGMDLDKPGAVLLIYNDGNWVGRDFAMKKYSVCVTVWSPESRTLKFLFHLHLLLLCLIICRKEKCSLIPILKSWQTLFHIYIYMYISVWMVG